MTETYKCENCEKSYDKGWTDEEAEEERSKNYPHFPVGECVLVCDDCYKMFRGEV